MKRFLIVILPVAVIGLGVLFIWAMIRTRPSLQPERREVPPPLVRVVPGERQSYQFQVAAQGSVLPRTDIQLVSEVAGRVERVSPSFAAGGFFEAGEVLVKIDPRDYELAVIRARAALAEAGVRVQREEAEADIAQREWKALGNGKPSALLLREPQLAEARAALESARANLKGAELDLERCQIKAPFAGRVWSKRADVGQFLNRGEAVARIYAIDYAEVRLPLPMEEAGFLELPLEFRGGGETAKGPPVVLKARLGSELQVWNGRLVRTEGEIDPRTRMMTVVARVEDPYARRGNSARMPLAVGLFVDALIEGRTVEEVTLAPRAALQDHHRVRVVDSENRLRFRPVEVLRREQDQVILKQGLLPGDRLCITPLEGAVDGMRVRVEESGKPLAAETEGR